MRQLTALRPKIGPTQGTRSRSVVTLTYLFPTQRTGIVGLKLVESRLTLLLPGFRFSLGSRACCITFSNFNIGLRYY